MDMNTTILLVISSTIMLILGFILGFFVSKGIINNARTSAADLLKNEFKNIANDVLVSSSDHLKNQVVGDIKLILNPVRENLKNFEANLRQNELNQKGSISELKQQITNLTEMNQTMVKEAGDLTRALKGESKTRGNWGEMILETILDKSGLIKNEHYTREKQFQGDEGKFRPDVIIYLPEGRHLVIDSKLNLVHYEAFVNADNDEARNNFINKHAALVENHIKQLSEKKYEQLHNIKTPDFTIMFIPLEPAFHAAIEHKGDLFGKAYERNIVLTSPSTLIPTLKIIYNIWRQEKQNKNAMEIAKAGGNLYDKFVGFVSDMTEIGSSIDKTKSSYDAALSKLSTGKGNLVTHVEKMKKLGAKASKQLPVELIEE